MAQLIKLNDYISRYHVNMYQYPAQFIRLKQENWQKMRTLYERGQLDFQSESAVTDETEIEKIPWWKALFREKKVEQPVEAAAPLESRKTPRSLRELKQYYLDGLLPFQLKWATTTLQNKSFLHPSYQEDASLSFYLQRFPDTYLLMYDPVAQLRNTDLEIDHILIGPNSLELITSLPARAGETAYVLSEHTWLLEDGNIQRKVPSPLISLKRTETFVRSVLKTHDIDFPYTKVVLSPQLSFEKMQEPYETFYIGDKEYNRWLYEKRQMRTPLKHKQLKTAEALLKHCRTSAVKRAEWDTEDPLEE